MHRRHELLPGRALGRSMHLWCYGHYGAPILVFPSASGMAHEWEVQGMVESLADLIDGGRIKLYCTETNVGEAWTRREGDPAWRLRLHRAFEGHVLGEVVPFIRADCHSAGIRVGAAGTSLGAFYSANFALKHSEVFHYALCMSGRYDMQAFAAGSSSLDLYFNSPLAYVRNLEGGLLERIRRETRLTLVCGQGAWEDGNIDETRQLAGLLAEKGIPHRLDVWGHDAAHEWVWWRRQAQYHLRAEFGG